MAHTPLSFALTEKDRSAVEAEFGMESADVLEAERIYSENKAPYVAKDGPLSTAGFRGWLRTSTAGKEIVKKRGGSWGAEAKRLGGGSRAVMPNESRAKTDGPPGWQEWVARECAGSAIAPGGAQYTTVWRELAPDHQQYIEKNMPKAESSNYHET